MNLGHRNAQLKKKVEELEATEKNWVQKEAEKNHRITQLEGELVTERGKRLATELMKKELEELWSEKENLPKLLDASFDEGYKKCGADLQEDVEKIQKRRYRRGYRVGWADALSKSFELLKVKDDDDIWVNAPEAPTPEVPSESESEDEEEVVEEAVVDKAVEQDGKTAEEPVVGETTEAAGGSKEGDAQAVVGKETADA